MLAQAHNTTKDFDMTVKSPFGYPISVHASTHILIHNTTLTDDNIIGMS